MTLEKALEICDAVKPNQYSRSEKIRWLSEADGMVQREIFDCFQPSSFEGYTEETPEDTVLLVPEPYCSLYEAYLSAQIDFYNGEFTRYQNSAQLYNAIFSALAAWYRRTHVPKQENSITIS